MRTGTDKSVINVALGIKRLLACYCLVFCQLITDRIGPSTIQSVIQPDSIDTMLSNNRLKTLHINKADNDNLLLLN